MQVGQVLGAIAPPGCGHGTRWAWKSHLLLPRPGPQPRLWPELLTDVAAVLAPGCLAAKAHPQGAQTRGLMAGMDPRPSSGKITSLPPPYPFLWETGPPWDQHEGISFTGLATEKPTGQGQTIHSSDTLAWGSGTNPPISLTPAVSEGVTRTLR